MYSVMLLGILSGTKYSDVLSGIWSDILTFCLAFYLAFWPSIYLLSGTLSGILTFYLACILALYVTFDLACSLKNHLAYPAGWHGSSPFRSGLGPREPARDRVGVQATKLARKLSITLAMILATWQGGWAGGWAGGRGGEGGNTGCIRTKSIIDALIWQVGKKKSKAGRSGFRAVLKLLYGIYDRSMALSSPATRALDATSCLPISTTQWLVGDITKQWWKCEDLQLVSSLVWLKQNV